jgi:YfiH family protein
MTNILFQEKILEYEFTVYSSEPEFTKLSVQQVHGNKISSKCDCEADGIVSTNLELPLAIKTADCLPIAIIGNNGFAMIHAGWRGLENKILASKEIQKLEAKTFYIGPHIESCCYEVSEEFCLNFPKSNQFSKISEKIYFSLSGEAKKQIQNLYPGMTINSANNCTLCSEHQFHSFRKNATSQRNWNILSRAI